jgi:hypothetical protein
MAIDKDVFVRERRTAHEPIAGFTSLKIICAKKLGAPVSSA